MDEAMEGLYRCCQGCQVGKLVGIGGRKPDRHTRDAECICREVVEQMRSAAVAVSISLLACLERLSECLKG